MNDTVKLVELADFDYRLPEELIAQEPLGGPRRRRACWCSIAASRWEDRAFRDFPSFLRPGDCLVLNDSRVFPARLFGHRAGVRVAAHREEQPQAARESQRPRGGVAAAAGGADRQDWEALVRPGRKMRLRERIRFDGGLEGEIVARGEFGERTIRVHGDARPVRGVRTHRPRAAAALHQAPRPAGRPRALPDGLRRARKGSVAAPTAGLHFTPEILDECRARGAEMAYVTLHVGLGTFQPLHTAQVETGAAARRALSWITRERRQNARARSAW